MLATTQSLNDMSICTIVTHMKLSSDVRSIEIPKLMAPINSFDGAVRVIRAGADEIYCGVAMPDKLKDFLLYRGPGKSRAQVPSYDELERIVEFAHKYRPKARVKGHASRVEVVLTINEPFMSELMKDEMNKHIRTCLDKGVDALIVGDFGVLSMLREMEVEVPLYASTYFASMNHEAVEFFRNLGFSRVVLERHLTINEISEIVKKSKVGIEVFCYSGGCSNINANCYFYHAIIPQHLWKHLQALTVERKSMLAPCAIDYDIYDVKDDREKICRAPILDALVECSLCYVQELVRIGVAGLKIVGRDQVANLQECYTRLYRQILDTIRLARGKIEPETLREKANSLLKDLERTMSWEKYQSSICEQKRCYYGPLFNVPYRSFITEKGGLYREIFSTNRRPQLV